MKTSKPFSTISYNTVDYLRLKLDELVDRRKIDFYAFVDHYPEEDEKKAHKHLLIVPNGRIDTDQVLDYLIEIDPSKPDKPLKCMRPQSSKFADWYLYAVHDSSYLASKGQARKYHYQQSDIVCSDTDYLVEQIHTIDFSKLNRFNELRSAARSGTPFYNLLMNGFIPVQQVYAYKQAYDIMSLGDTTERNGKQGHEPKIDEDTGEIIDE